MPTFPVPSLTQLQGSTRDSPINIWSDGPTFPTSPPPVDTSLHKINRHSGPHKHRPTRAAALRNKKVDCTNYAASETTDAVGDNMVRPLTSHLEHTVSTTLF